MPIPFNIGDVVKCNSESEGVELYDGKKFCMSVAIKDIRGRTI
jgi:hypothetical protein